jgi:DNA polymerase-3 subunit delta'
VSGFDELPDQQRPARLLKAALVGGSLPNAYLFTGPDGVGKKEAARILAMALNCCGRAPGPEPGSGPARTEPCGACRACRKIRSASHPDILRIAPSGSYIKVDQVRELCRRLSLKSNEARVRVAVLEEAQTLNPEAGNTLLKILEEPPARTLFVLLARQSSEILPTIVSRCRHIRFNPVSAQSIQAHIAANYPVSADDAAVIGKMAGGSLSRAAEMTEKGWIGHRRWIIETLCALDGRPLHYHFAFGEALAGDARRLQTSLEIMNSWFRDLAVYSIRPDCLINEDFSEKIAGESGKYSLGQLTAATRAIDEAARQIGIHANPRLAVEHLLIALHSRKEA